MAEGERTVLLVCDTATNSRDERAASRLRPLLVSQGPICHDLDMRYIAGLNTDTQHATTSDRVHMPELVTL
jgi:hypothetical protein